nr:tetratricopeptide repeat protein [Pleurocapsa sp. PCC 7327]
MRGFVYYNLQKWDLALADYNQAIELNPNYDGAYSNRGLLYADRQQWELAEADFDRVISLDPNDAMAYGNRGLLCYRRGDKQAAIQDLQTSAQLCERQGDLAGYQNALELLTRVAKVENRDR